MTITKKKAFSIALLITVANIIAKLLGFFKDILISYYYGANAMTDAIFLAMSIPTIILGIFTSSTDSAIIPQYNRILSTGGREAADKYFSNIINIIFVITFAVSTFIFLCPGIFVEFFAPGFTDIQLFYSTKFLRLFSFFGLFHFLYCFFCTYNTIYAKVGIRSFLSFSTNLLVVIAILIYPDPNMIMLSIAYFTGNIIAAVIPILSVRKSGYKHTYSSLTYDTETKKFIELFTPIMGTALLADLSMFVDRYLASNMGEGGISALNYASRLTSIFDNLLVVGLGVVLLPLLSQLQIKKDFVKFNQYTAQIIKLVIVGLAPVTLICMLLPIQIIEVIYMRGKFGVESVNIVSSVFLCYSPLVMFLPLQAVFAKIFHSLENTKTPFLINLMSIIVNTALSIILSYNYGLIGISIATSISVVLSCIMFFIVLRKRLGWDNSVFGYKELFVIIDCIIVLVIIVKLLNLVVSGALMKIIIAGGFGVLGYILILVLLMPKEVRFLLSFFRKKHVNRQ